MDAVHIAVSQVRDLQRKILEKQRFKGYSGRARAISGTLALITAVFLSLPVYPKSVAAHLAGWTALLLISILLNFGAILYWFLFDLQTKRDLRRLRPLIDVLPPLFVGALFTFAFLMHGLYSFLFGVWMCIFGLANFASRHCVPNTIWIPSLFYLICGTLFLLQRDPSFLNPWPMGLVFFIGEWAGGFILHFDGSEQFSVRELRNIFSTSEDQHAR
jgi:hypothetical protein